MEKFWKRTDVIAGFILVGSVVVGSALMFFYFYLQAKLFNAEQYLIFFPSSSLSFAATTFLITSSIAFGIFLSIKNEMTWPLREKGLRIMHVVTFGLLSVTII